MIVLPHNQASTMTSAGVQADVTDAEGILGVIQSFKQQLDEIQQSNETLQDLGRARAESLQTTQRTSERLSDKISELLNDAQTMETILKENQDAMQIGNKELEDLLNEKESLDHMVGGVEMTVSDGDIVNERRLTGFVEAELLRKLDELSVLNHRFIESKAEYDAEWEEHKKETKEYEESVKEQEASADHLKEMTLARCVGVQSTTGSGSDLVKRMVQHHANHLTYRQLRQQMAESREKEHDLENEIGNLIQQKRELWTRCLDLENCLEELKDTSDETNMLHPAPAYSDLPAVMEGELPSKSISDLDLTEEPTYGRMLHRCHKTTDLTLRMSAAEQEDVEVTIRQDYGPTEPEHVQNKGIDASPDDITLPPSDDSLPSAQEDESELLPSKDELVKTVLTKLQEQSTSQVDTHIENVEEPSQSLVSKIRKRVGGFTRTSSILRGKGKITATGSTRHYDPNQMSGKKRR